jgi:DNA-directed RNA polymerase specialized sigma24 family protein
LHRLKNLENREAWENVFELYWRMMVAVVRRTGLSEMDAEDMVMETIECVPAQGKWRLLIYKT